MSVIQLQVSGSREVKLRGCYRDRGQVSVAAPSMLFNLHSYWQKMRGWVLYLLVSGLDNGGVEA